MNDELDRWKALAEELGLPSEPASAKKAPEPPAPPAPRRQVETPPRAEAAPVVSAPEPAALEVPPAAPAFRAEPAAPALRAEPAAPFEEPVSLPPITSLDTPHLDPMLEGPSLDKLPEPAMPLEEPAEPDRSRGRGRRGQRGGRGRRGERSESPTGEPEPAGESADASGRRRGGRGRRGERRPEPEPEPEEVLSEEEPIDNVEEEEVDDGPDDNLADLNLPSWADIIGSLYRPER